MALHWWVVPGSRSKGELRQGYKRCQSPRLLQGHLGGQVLLRWPGPMLQALRALRGAARGWGVWRERVLEGVGARVGTKKNERGSVRCVARSSRDQKVD